MGVWATCSSRRRPCLWHCSFPFQDLWQQLIPSMGTAGGSRDSTISPWVAKRPPHLPTQYHGAALLLPLHISRPPWAEKGEQTTAWPLEIREGGPPMYPASCSSCPRAGVQRRTAALKVHFWGKGCRAQRAKDTWEHRVPRCPARSPAATAMEGSGIHQVGELKHRTQQAGQG